MLIIGVIVLVVVIAFVYKVFFHPSINESECRTRITAWCARCKTDGSTPDDKLVECAQKFYGMSATFDCQSAEDDCKAFLPI